MRSHAELVAANQAIRKLLESGVEASLRSIPGVLHVSVGLKERGARATDELCIRVYVREKLPEDRLAPGDRIPASIDGVPTDVLVKKQFAFTVYSAAVRPLKGGTMISNGIIVAGEDGGDPTVMAGTFGCTATRTSDGKVMLLTSGHVLKANDGRKNDPVYQPPQLPVPRVHPSRLPLRPTSDENRIGYIADVQMTDRVDAGIVRLDISSCCRCCGLDYRDEVIDLSVDGVPPSNRLLGMRPAVPGSRVYKVGITTGRTVGTVLDTDVQPGEESDSGYRPIGQIEIAGENYVFEPFAAEGDSGAIIVDDDGFVVGLLMGSDTEYTPEGRHYANHIADVCSVLGITLNLDRSASDSAGLPMSKQVFQPRDEDVELYASARARLRAEPAGEWLWHLAEKHREEVVELVTTHRPVTVAWHRAGGPALFAGALRTLRAGGTALPVPTDGATLEDALRRIGDALHKSGSAGLRADLEVYAPQLLAAVRGSLSLDDVLEKLRSQLPAPVPNVDTVVPA